MFKYTIELTTKFQKDLEKAKKQNKDLEPLFTVIETLSKGEKLHEKYKDHPLKGNYKGKRECHVGNDFLLIYQIIENKLVLLLVRAGTHSELF